MTTKRSYYCDLCNTSDKGTNLVGIYWTSTVTAKEMPKEQCEHHICKDCIRAITQMPTAKPFYLRDVTFAELEEVAKK